MSLRTNGELVCGYRAQVSELVERDREADELARKYAQLQEKMADMQKVLCRSHPASEWCRCVDVSASEGHGSIAHWLKGSTCYFV